MQSELPFAFDLLPPQAMFSMARVLAEGEHKYGPNNWKKIPVRQHLNHAIAHCFAYLAGDITDSHLSHAITRIAFAIELTENVGLDHAV
jgi:tagatose-1,6-bisphosphate aldolase non-catalytic subunit AgaZ/GatZ